MNVHVSVYVNLLVNQLPATEARFQEIRNEQEKNEVHKQLRNGQTSQLERPIKQYAPGRDGWLNSASIKDYF